MKISMMSSESTKPAEDMICRADGPFVILPNGDAISTANPPPNITIRRADEWGPDGVTIGDAPRWSFVATESFEDSLVVRDGFIAAWKEAKDWGACKAEHDSGGAGLDGATPE